MHSSQLETRTGAATVICLDGTPASLEALALALRQGIKRGTGVEVLAIDPAHLQAPEVVTLLRSAAHAPRSTSQGWEENAEAEVKAT